ncbi:hypothetical protein EG328_009064 [Venturia inaequalis]|nr:hypothetical protein EG327_006704 [Venturia inaequalis]KAE9984185.1 hypothetical protein EG328_009064 [Venturia inaequalis]RDI82613.1 hypothetical protein Vi05172_g7406 [Venturia inaequalis]
MKYYYALVAFIGLAAASPILNARQVHATPPALGSPESFAQAASILGGIGKGVGGLTSIPFAADSGKALEGLAKGLGQAGSSAPKTGGTAATGSAQQQAEASAIINGLGNGLKGAGSIPFGKDAGGILSGIAQGLGGKGLGGAA